MILGGTLADEAGMSKELAARFVLFHDSSRDGYHCQ
jgi:hypothetical protein